MKVLANGTLSTENQDRHAIRCHGNQDGPVAQDRLAGIRGACSSRASMQTRLSGGGRRQPSLVEPEHTGPIESPEWFSDSFSCSPQFVDLTRDLPEVGRNGAVRVDPLDVESVASGILQRISSGQFRADLQARGLHRLAIFTWEKTTESTRRVLEAYA